jgi:hypothetical protein
MSAGGGRPEGDGRGNYEDKENPSAATAHAGNYGMTPQTVITILAFACPSPRYRMASAHSLSA